MGFHLRKSFNFGGIRLNLSSSGIGFSTGIKGLRVGIDGKGRSYISGGKGPVRYRKTWSNNQSGETPILTKHIENSDVPLELQGNSLPTFLMFICGPLLGLILIGILLDPPPKEVFIFLCIFFIIPLSLPFLSFNKSRRAWLLNEGLEAYNSKSYERALEKFKKLESLVKNLKWLTREFVADKIYNCFINLQLFDEAIEFITDNRNIYQPTQKLILLYQTLQQSEKLINIYNREKDIINTMQVDSDIYNAVYEAYINLKNYLGALEFAQKTPQLGWRYDKIIECYKMLEDFEGLINFIQKDVGRTKMEEHPTYFAILGDAFLNLGKNEIALETMLTGPVRKRNMDDEMCAFRYVLGKCYEANGDKANALKQYQKIYSYDVNYEDVSEKIQALEV